MTDVSGAGIGSGDALDADVMDGKSDSNEGSSSSELSAKSIRHIMKRSLGGDHDVLTSDAVDAVQCCTSEFLSLITSEARVKALKEGRTTVGYADLMGALNFLGFKPFLEPLKAHMMKHYGEDTRRQAVKRPRTEAAPQPPPAMPGIGAPQPAMPGFAAAGVIPPPSMPFTPQPTALQPTALQPTALQPTAPQLPGTQSCTPLGPQQPAAPACLPAALAPTMSLQSQPASLPPQPNAASLPAAYPPPSQPPPPASTPAAGFMPVQPGAQPSVPPPQQQACGYAPMPTGATGPIAQQPGA